MYAYPQFTYLAKVDILGDFVLNALDNTPVILDTITLLESQALEANAEEEIPSQDIRLLVSFAYQ